jgi:protein-disulfide isomerase
MKKLLALVAIATLAMPAFAQTPVAPPSGPALNVTVEERSKIELVVRDMLDREPELIIQAAQKFQMKQQQSQLAKAGESIRQNAQKLFNDAGSATAGNAKGDVNVVEFFDYNCGYCKRAHTTTQQLIKDDKNLRYVYKQFPILGPTSLTAAQAAAAAHLQGKFVPMHDALMANKEPLSDAVIAKLGGSIKGLDVAKLKTDMNGDAVKKQIAADMELGRQLGIQGTPGFVVGDQLFPGAMDLEQFKKAVAEARAKAPAKN